MLSTIINNYKMINPLPAIWWFGIGWLAQFFHPYTPINSDNMSVVTFQFGIVLSVFLALSALFIASIFYGNRTNESKFLKFIYSSSKQFADLAMAVFGFSTAYYVHTSVYDFALLLMTSSLLLATAVNHIFLVVFDERDVGTLKWALNLDRKYNKTRCNTSVKILAGLVALATLSFLAAFISGKL
jgi:hypothetical protein